MDKPTQISPKRAETCLCGHLRLAHDKAGAGACHGDIGLCRCLCLAFNAPPELRQTG